MAAGYRCSAAGRESGARDPGSNDEGRPMGPARRTLWFVAALLLALGLAVTGCRKEGGSGGGGGYLPAPGRETPAAGA
jgi:hypothetical protein